jgi:hypothetical protein
MAFFNFARRYHEAANCVFKEQGALSDPAHFLYFHTVELALKAFLRSHDIQILGTWRSSRSGHQLTKLYDECRILGLKIRSDDKFQIGNIVSNLDQANEYQGLRYYNPKSGVMASLSWTREVVEQLMQAVELRFRGLRRKVPAPAPDLKVTLIWGKPKSLKQNVRA